MSEQMEDDIRKWADEKIDQWAKDVLVRCEIADIDPRPLIGAITMTMCGTFIAATSMPAAEAGKVFAEMVASFRRTVLARMAQSK